MYIYFCIKRRVGLNRADSPLGEWFILYRCQWRLVSFQYQVFKCHREAGCKGHFSLGLHSVPGNVSHDESHQKVVMYSSQIAFNPY